jgi:predicted transcriptional regulator of viral defense system
MDSLRVTRIMDEHRAPVFTTQQISAMLGMDPPSATVKLHRLARGGALVRVMRGRYCLPSVHPLAAASGLYVPSYVSMLAAFEFHGTTTQSSRVIDIMNTKRSGSLSVTLDAGPFVITFIHLPPSMIYGYERVRLNGKDAFVASKERAIVDGLMMPGNVPLDETVACLRSGIDVERLVDYTRRTGRQVVVKRMGHLMATEGIPFDPADLGEITDTYVPLDPSFPRRGEHDPRWRVIRNRVIE